MAYSIGTIDPLNVTSYDGFDLPSDATVVRLLSDGTTTHNAVVQSSGSSLPEARIVGITTTEADIIALRAYRLSHELVTFSATGESDRTVLVLEFSARQDKMDGVWDWSATLVESDAAVDGPGVGLPVAGLDTTLAADPAVAATNLKVASVTTVTANDFVRVGAAGVTATALNSEVVRVLTVGTTGSGGTGLDIVSDTGGGMVLDRASADEVKTVTGHYIAAPASAGASNLKVDSVAALTGGDVVRIGYLNHYEERTLTVVGTAGAAGTGITFGVGLAKDHSIGEWVVVTG